MGIDIGDIGGIKVNDRLETNIKDVYAAGDCAEAECFVRKAPVLTGLGTIATRQGMVAGINAAGGDAMAPPVLSASVMRLFDVDIGAVGPTEDFAKESGIEVAASTV
jgi:NADPH-dependent 2,4-dienoyl-CoA reductase/sulfur reductase-like enzyme